MNFLQHLYMYYLNNGYESDEAFQHALKRNQEYKLFAKDVEPACDFWDLMDDLAKGEKDEIRDKE